MTDWQDMKVGELADVIGVPACKVYTALLQLRNQQRAQAMQSWELVAAFERHGVPKQDHRALTLLIRLGKASRRLQARRAEFQSCLNEIWGIITKREKC